MGVVTTFVVANNYRNAVTIYLLRIELNLGLTIMIQHGDQILGRDDITFLPLTMYIEQG